jgi:hypothetical protein
MESLAAEAHQLLIAAQEFKTVATHVSTALEALLWPP